MAVLLIYNISGPELKRLKTLCAKKSVRARAVSPGDYGEPVGALCSLRERTGAPAPDGEVGQMLVFAGFGENQLDMLLAELDTVRIGKNAIKAAVTRYNAAWDSVRLWQELSREHEEMAGHEK